MKKPAILGSVSLITVAALAGGLYFSSNYSWPKFHKAPGPVEKITIGTYAGNFSTLLFVAKKKGYFRDNGLEAAIKVYPSGALALADLAAGRIELAASTEWALTNKILKDGQSLKCLGTIAHGFMHSLMARKDRGIARPGDLKGRKIGVTKVSAEFFLNNFLVRHGLAESDVELVDLPPTGIMPALEDGNVDAVFTWEPIVNEIKTQMGSGVIHWSQRGDQETYWVLSTSDEVARTRTDTLERLFRALALAEGFTIDHEAEAKVLVSQATGQPQGFIDAVWADCRYVLALNQPLLTALEDEARWVMKNRPPGKAAMPNFLNILQVEPLHRAKPEAVRLLGIKAR
jgi:NitT/TauT family transport system substrate-binding protein